MKSYVITGVRNRTLLTSYGLLDSYRHPVRGTDCQIRKAIDFSEGYADKLCYEIEDRKQIRVLMEKEIREGMYTQKFFDDLDKRDKVVVRNIKAFSDADLSMTSNEQLIEYFDTFYQIYITTFHPMILAIYASDLQDVFDAELKKTVGNVSQLEMLEHTALLLTPTRLTQVQKEEQLLFELQDEFERSYAAGNRTNFEEFCKKQPVSAIFEKLAKTCGWFHMEYIGEPKTVHDYQQQLWDRITDLRTAGSNWAEQVSPQSRLQNLKEQQAQFLDSHGSSEFFRALVFAMQEYLIVLDYTKADLIEGIYYARPLLAEIGRRVGLDSWIDVRFLLGEEVKRLLEENTRVDFSYIKVRKEHFATFLHDGKLEVYFGDDAIRLVDELVQKEEAGDVKEFKGMTAYPGKVRGIACIVRGAHERDKFKKGNILVTHDTTTELTSVIKLSAAIVADNGSLLSHTAIVSREFKIPCLVLTKFATKLVKDGDELEVDASNGIVRILS